MGSSPSSSSNPFLFGFLSLVCFLFFVENKLFVSAITRKGYSELHHHRVPLGSFFPSSTCKSPPQGRSREGSLEVVHKHGPCSKLRQHSPSTVKAPLIIPHGEILEQDKGRVRAIQSKLWKGQRQAREGDGGPASSPTEAPDQQVAPLPARSGDIIGSDSYYVTVGLGTPVRELSLLFDTGSDLTWTQCFPCNSPESCFTQKEPTFDPSQSSSYSNIPCSSSQCSQLSSAIGDDPTCSDGDCIYDMTYDDGSTSKGNFAEETLTITSTQVADNFLFGCGHDNKGLFNGTAGLIGLGRGPVSMVQQTSGNFNKIFSYCMPSTESDVGFLTFGGVPSSDNIIYTPLSSFPDAPSFYALDLTGISVAGTTLSIQPTAFFSGVIIDSGTVISRLPQEVYGPLRDTFRRAMSSRYPMVDQPVELFDTCYNLSGYETVVVPKVTLSFGGGANVELDPSGVLYGMSETLACLAFAPNEDANEITIIGNTQQRTFEVVYDLDGDKLGFGPHSCSGSSNFINRAATSNLNRRSDLLYFIYLFAFYFFIRF